MPWFLLSPGISILDSGILFSIHPAATPNPESAENRLAAGVGRARRWLPRSMGHHPTLPPPARLRIPANGSYSRIGKALHDRAHRAGPQAEKDDRISRRDGRARTGGGGTPGAGGRGQAGTDRRAAGECAPGRGVRGSGDFAGGEEIRRAVLRAPASQGDDAGGSGGGGEEAAVLRLADGRRSEERRGG